VFIVSSFSVVKSVCPGIERINTIVCPILDELARHGTALIATSQGIDTRHNNPVGRLRLNVLMAVAEFEREVIGERINAGLPAAKARSVKLGRRASHNYTPGEVKALKARGLGVRAIARELNIAASSAWTLLRAEAEVKAV
jgi:DNA invertase Pin-like site-specific DNA recombinase